MASKLKQALDALETRLKTLESDVVKVYRNQDKPEEVAASGAVFMLYDGAEDEGAREEILSPLTYVVTWSAQLEVHVQHENEDARSAALDNYLMAIGSLFPITETLGGLVHYVEVQTPSIDHEGDEGAVTDAMALVDILFEYSTENLLQ